MSLFTALIFTLLLPLVLNNCTKNSLLFGCLSCTSGQQLALQPQSNGTFTHICTAIVNCTIVDTSNPPLCIQCKAGSIVATDNSSKCIALLNCASATTLNCTICNVGYAFNSASPPQCVLINSPYCWQFNLSSCSVCPASYLIQSNCTIDTAICASFDYTLWACVQCPPSMVLHSSAVYCITVNPRCILYNITACVACFPNYYVQNNNCVFVPALYYYDSSNIIPISKCIDSNLVFNTITLLCSSTILSHCAMAVGAKCTKCVVQYYLNNGSCTRCSQQNCLNCNSTICLMCLPGYYLPTCTKCINCLYCNANECLVCNLGWVLFQGSCIQCEDGSSYDVNSRQCVKCKETNCKHCKYVNSSQEKCVWCSALYVLNGTNCVNINLGNGTNSTNGVQYISKVLSISSSLIYNNQAQMISKCVSSSNGFQCECNKSTHSSVCTSIPTSLLQFTSHIQLNISAFVQQIDYQRLLSQIPSYTLLLTINAGDVLSLDHFASLLQILANIVNREYNVTLITQIAQFARTNMQNVFDETKCTVLYGLGYYMKYRPNRNVSDNKEVISTNLSVDSQYPQLSLIFFNTYPSKLTGVFSIFTKTPTSTTVMIETVNPLLENEEGYLYINAVKSEMVKLSEGRVQIPLTTNTKYYMIEGNAVAAVADPFEGSRIEKVLLQDAYVYILVFLLLYLVLLPVCALVDFVEEKPLPRKAESEESAEEVIKINYKDFFPLYNIANSPRTSRLKKVCLYIVNVEHGVTFLALMYFRLGAGQSIVAVALGIPAYFCTVGMSYVCGAIIRKAQGTLPYLLNVLTLVYWVVWVVTMSQFTAQEYKPFIYFFLPVFIFLDLLTDLLETLLVYFAISQEEQQIALFNRLAQWLSWKGYYQFIDLANKLQQRQHV